jgi:uncharacterized protein
MTKRFFTFFIRTVFLSSFSASLMLSLAFSAAAKQDDFFIGTAGIDGVYYPAASAMCILVERANILPKHCRAISTGGSIYNLNAVRLKEMDFGVAQSDWQYHAYNGTALFERLGADKSLRSLFSLHSEPFTLIVRQDSGIKTFDDLRGKRVNIGSPGSGIRATMEMLMRAKGWTTEDFKSVMEKKVNEQNKELCDNNVDAVIYSGGHPNGAVQEVTTLCDAVIVPVEGEAIEALIKQFPFYAAATIPGGMYTHNPQEVKTFGVKATLVSNESVDEELVYYFIKIIFGNFETFKTLHPVFSTLDKKSMVKDGNIAPFHKGALRYFQETGLIASEKPEQHPDTVLSIEKPLSEGVK